MKITTFNDRPVRHVRYMPDGTVILMLYERRPDGRDRHLRVSLAQWLVGRGVYLLENHATRRAQAREFEALIWQDRVPPPAQLVIGAAEIAALQKSILLAGLSISELVATAWASVSTFRGGDKRGGGNGARLRLLPQKEWEFNDPARTARVLRALEAIQTEFNGRQGGGKATVSLADLIVLGGCGAIEQAARSAGHNVEVPFHPGRSDASQEQTDGAAFAVLEPAADGFRNYLGKGQTVLPEHLLVDRAHLLTLSVPEMTVLVGGLRVLEANFQQSLLGVFTHRPGTLTNNFFVNLLDMNTQWEPQAGSTEIFEGRDRSTGAPRWIGSRVNLVFGSNSQLRAVAEVYACNDGEATFVHDFIAACAKVMDLDRFDLS